MPASPRVAIVHDWLVGGGAERVVEQLHVLYPDAPIYTSYCTPEWRTRLDGKVVTGWLQHLGQLRKFLAPLRIWWFTHLDLSQYDLVISSSGNGEALGVKTLPDTLHVNYCHTPTHFYWRFYDEYMRNPGFGRLNPLAKLGLKLLVKPLRAWDYKAAQRPDYFIANSSHIKAEIKEFYGRESTVIFPPVDTERFTANARSGKVQAGADDRRGYITTSRQVPQKKIDVLIGACNELNLPLTVVGRGPEHARLSKLAGPTVTMRDDVTDAELPKLLASADAFLFAAYEDFGVSPVEALAAGTPVLAYKAGGALDYVIPGKTGAFFDVQAVPSLCAALQQFNPKAYNTDAISRAAEHFSIAAFQNRFTSFITSLDKGDKQ